MDGLKKKVAHRKASNQSVIDVLMMRLKAIWRTADQIARSKAVDTVEYELEELEHIFGLLIGGMFVGLPAPPVHMAMELMPLIEHELNLMFDKVTLSHDALGQLFSILKID